MPSICSSTSFMDILPRNTAATVKYRPCLGSQAAIIFLASNICWVSSGTDRALYCWLQLAREPQAGRHTRHGQRNKVVQISVSWVGQLQCAEADVVESLVINAEGFISVLNKLVHGECGIVGLHHCVRHLAC